MPATAPRPAAPASARKGIVLPRVEVFSAGVWQGDVYTVADLDDMVRNFAELYPTVEPPVKIGHEEDQEFSGVPAVGWVVRLWREGPKLFADLEQVFPEIAELIEAGAYRKVSAEIYPPGEPPEGVKADGLIFKAVSFLGGRLPHIKQLADLPRPVRFAEKIRRPRLHLPPALCMMRGAGQRHRVFFEATPMDRAALEAQLKGIGWTDEMIAALASLKDDDLAAFVLLALAQSAGATPAPEPTATEAEVMWPDGMDRNAVIAELVAMGEEQATLDALSDEELIALYEQKKAAMSDTNPTPPAKPVATPTPAGGPPKKVTYSFAEQRAAIAREARKAVRVETERANAATRRAGIHTFCEQMVKENRLTPAQVEVGKDGKPVGKTLLMLLSLPAVRTFAEPGKLSPLELAMEEIRSRPPVRRFGEQLPDPLPGSQLDSLTERAKAWAARRNGKVKTA